MDELDWFHVAPNVPQPLQVKVHRLRLGNQAFEAYPHPALSSGFFAVWIPPLGGDLTIEVAGAETSNLQLWSGMTPLRKVHGAKLVHRIAPGTSGRFDVHVSPHDRALRATLSVEGWPVEADGTPLVPWNFWYFPYHRQPLLSADAARWSFPSHEIQISAMKKYDRIAPPAPGSHSAESWERAYHCSAQHGWEGHCDPGAYASVYFQQPPTEVPMGDVVFSRHELELLAAEWAGARMATIRGWNHGQRGTEPAFTIGSNRSYVTHLLKPEEEPTFDNLRKRYRDTLPEPIPDELGLAIDQEAARIASDPKAVHDAFGKAALTFWDFLMAETLHARDPIIGDVGPVEVVGRGRPTSPAAVWNHAIAKVQLSVVEKGGTEAAPDPRVVEARIVMVTNLDVQPKPPLRPDPEPDAADAAPADILGGRPVPRAGCHQAHIYDLEFRFDADGVLLGSAWRRARIVEPSPASAVWAPRRFGIPAQPRRVATPAGQVPPGNTIIDSALLKLVQLRARYL